MRTERRMGQGWVWLALILLVFSVLVINATATYSRAEEAAAAAAAGPGAAAGPAGPATSRTSGGSSRCSGFIGFVILCLSVYFVATVARMFMELRLVTAMPPEVVSRCEAMLEQRDFKGIFNVVKEDDSYFSRVLVTGITELPNGLSEARESMERVADLLTAEMEKKISMLAVLGTLGPMIGLLGTLKGMIASFSVIASQRRAAEGQPGRRRYFPGPRADVRGGGFGGAGDLLLRRLPQPRVVDFGDRPDAGRRVPAALCPGGTDQGGPPRPPLRQGVRGGPLMSGSVSSEITAAPNLTPLLDMVFQLITFFMLVINFKSAELDLALKLPVVGSARSRRNGQGPVARAQHPPGQGASRRAI